MKTLNEIWTLVKEHIEIQLLTLTGINSFQIMNPSRGGSEVYDGVSYLHQVKVEKSKWMMGGDRYPSFIMEIEVGILISDAKKDAHDDRVTVANGVLIEWFDKWVNTRPYYASWNPYIDMVGYSKHTRGITAFSNGVNGELRTSVWIKIPLSGDRR